MAVYTEVGDEELVAFAAEYDIGEVLSCKGIAEGIENSNFALATTDGNFILTLYEKRVNADDLPFFLGLMDHLAEAGIPCPTPVHGRDGKALRRLCGRPAAIVTFLSGMWPRRITPAHTAELGTALAKFHLAGADFDMSRDNDLSVAGWRPLLAKLEDRADEVEPGLAKELAAEMEALAEKADVLLTPSTPTPALADITNTGNTMFQGPWTSCGLPVITIPSGLAASGLPFGIQLAAAPFSEPKLLAAARWCENVLDVELSPPVNRN